MTAHIYTQHLRHAKEMEKCSVCDKEMTHGNLKTHMVNVHGGKMHHCELCEVGFSALTSLRNHQEKVHSTPEL